MKCIRFGVLALFVCWCSAAMAADTPAMSGHDMHDMHAGHAMDDKMEAMSDAGIADMSLEFELVNQDGDLVTDDEFRGKNVLLAFGFTHCIHICPLIAANMANALKVAKKDSVGVFISVDSERDTPAITHRYASHFGPSMIGLSGSYEQLATTAKNFNATFVVTKTQDSYTVQHSPGIFLIGPDGELIDVFAINTAPEDIVAAMK